MDPFSLFHVRPPVGVPTWTDVQMLEAARSQAQAAWSGVAVQGGGLVAAVFAALYAKGAYRAANDQAKSAREQLDQSRRADALTAYHELLTWLTEGKADRMGTPDWRTWIEAMAPSPMLDEIGVTFRSHSPGTRPAAASIAAGRAGGVVLGHFTETVAAHEALYHARVAMGKAWTTRGAVPEPEVQRVLPEAKVLSERLREFLDSLEKFERVVNAAQ